MRGEHLPQASQVSPELIAQAILDKINETPEVKVAMGKFAVYWMSTQDMNKLEDELATATGGFVELFPLTNPKTGEQSIAYCIDTTLTKYAS